MHRLIEIAIIFGVFGVLGFFAHFEDQSPETDVHGGTASEMKFATDQSEIINGQNDNMTVDRLAVRPGDPVGGLSQRAAASSVLQTGTGEPLYAILFSKNFVEGNIWQKNSEAIVQRFAIPLSLVSRGSQSESSEARTEIIARLGIAKALGQVRVRKEQAPVLKTLLLRLIHESVSSAWVLQREILHSLIASGVALSEEERENLMPALDVRAKGLATRRDREILETVLRHAAGRDDGR